MRLLLWLLLLAGCTEKVVEKEDFKIERLHHPYSRDYYTPGDSTKKDKEVYFIVSGCRENRNCENTIDSFVCNYVRDSVMQYTYYTVLMLRKSEKSNQEYLDRVPRDLDRYSLDKDILFKYSFYNGNLKGKTTYRDTIYMQEEMRMPARTDDTFKCPE